MRQPQKRFLLWMLLTTMMSARLRAWDGTGTSSDPYLVQNADDWTQLATALNEGQDLKGKVFLMTADINVGGTSVGEHRESAFTGVFDGGGHTLTYGDPTGTQNLYAPFGYADGATIRNLRTEGEFHTSWQYAAGIVSTVVEHAVSISDCKSAVVIHSNGVENAAHGGIVGAVASGGLTLDRCLFSGSFNSVNSAGMVGWSNVDITITNSMVSPAGNCVASGNRTFARMAEGATLNLADSYATMDLSPSNEAPQGIYVFNTVNMPEGCTCTIDGEPTVQYDGEKYWKSGAWVTLTAPEGAAFNHWDGGACFVSDPWTKSGAHQLLDIKGTPTISIANSMPEAEERTMDGTRYHYLKSGDYHIYVSDETCREKGWQIRDGYLMKNVSGDWAYIMAVTGWVGGSIPSDGAQIHNDLAGDWYGHTLTGLIAPHAFEGCTELKTLYFKDTDANNKNALQGFDLIIGEKAFAGCPNLTEVKMMQYTTKGSNHWDMIRPAQVSYIAGNAFEGSPKARVSCHRDVYQDYLSSEAWKSHRSRIIVYDATVEDFNVDGVRYHEYRDKTEVDLLTNKDKQAMMDNHVRIWAADYQQLNPADLLTCTDESQNVYYTSVVGVDDGYLDSHDGKMVIMNDLGTYYNYKTICLGRGAIAGNSHVRSIEFRQVNGNQTSRSDLKMVIQNGALKGCDNLRELRMFYWCEDGDDHWETLGPQDVIPGDDIFGRPTAEELEDMSEEERKAKRSGVPEGFKILVAPDRVAEFLLDPNWSSYLSWIEAVEYGPDNKKEDFTIGSDKGITYGYITNPGGIFETSQTVSQDVSWWTALRIGYEVAKTMLGIVSSYNEFVSYQALQRVINNLDENNVENAFEQLAPFISSNINFKTIDKATWNKLLDEGFVNRNGQWIGYNALNYGYVGVGEVYDVAYHLSDYYRGKAISMIPSKLLLLAGSDVSAYLASKQWGGSGSYNGDKLQKGMRENIKSNMHQVGVVGGGYVFTTPVKNISYHTYVKEVRDDVTRAVIHAGTDKGQGNNANTTTTTFAKNAFRDHKNLTHVSFFESNVTTNEAVPMLITIPDSAFVGCDNLEELSLLLDTDGNGKQALGPESFILAGDSVFAGLDPRKFHILIDPSRKQDFLDNESWAPLEKYFVYEPARANCEHDEYGGQYAFAYENGSVQKVHKEKGHKIEHTVVIGPTTEGSYLLSNHQGALKLCNDIGSYNNYQLDAVRHSAFKGNQDLRVVYFTDLLGTGAYGDCYTGLDVTLEDSCFAYCKNLADIDMLYIVTDGDNHIDPIRPEQVKLGKGVLEGTTAQIKMMPRQLDWFEADTTWNKLRDRFLPCVIQPGDEGVRKALKKMAYYDMAATGYDPEYWTDYIDLARIAGAGFSWLDGKFTEYKDDIRSFADFRHFAHVGLDYVGSGWFRDCRNLSNIMLPATIKTIKAGAFENCGKLEEMELPAGLTSIEERAFAGCTLLNTIVVRGETPAAIEDGVFTKNDALRIYVPDGKVDAYRQAWKEYEQYIAGIGSLKTDKTVTLTQAGTLAEKLGLTVEWSYTGMLAGDEPRYIHGNYAKYDSLTISGPLNDLDLAVIRYLAGCDSYTPQGMRTDGRLRHLNLYDARIVKDDNKAHFYNMSAGLNSEWYCIQKDDELPDYTFAKCASLESVILPRSVKSIGCFIFEGCSALKRLAVTGSVSQYDTWYSLSGLLSHPLDELVFLTDSPAQSSCSDPWGQPISAVITKQSQIGDYLGQPYLAVQAQNIIAPFEDDAVLEALRVNGQYFPSEYLEKEDVDGIFTRNNDIVSFRDFNRFSKVRDMKSTFTFARSLRSVALPDSVRTIGKDAFGQCIALDSIYISTDSIPELAPDAFSALPADFRIFVPRNLCKAYRTRWAQYADHINPDTEAQTESEILVVTTKEKNTLAKELGLEVVYDTHVVKSDNQYNKNNITFLCGVRGDYSNIRRLKVVGPISGGDLCLLRYLSGFCAWANTRNSLGQLEYIDLYDAQIQASEYEVASDMFWSPKRMDDTYVKYDNELPAFSFLQCYSLRTLILPKTLKTVKSRALQECEALETLVIGDETTEFNWSALDDDAMLSKLYILSRQKPELPMDCWLWRNLCNNYHPTFDAFYVRPSLYQDYLRDDAYTGLTWQRTNNISAGEFRDDESFLAFASHAAATPDDLRQVSSVEGWFDGHAGITDLTALKYTSVDSISKVTIEPLAGLQKIALPATLGAIERGTFEKATGLRYVDMMRCDTTTYLLDSIRGGGLAKMGIDTQKTLVYVPALYGQTQETNVVVCDSTEMKAAAYRLNDEWDYSVPYAFKAERIENSRTLLKSNVPYTVCVPYTMDVPANSRAYKLAERDGSTLTFMELERGERLEAMRPYLVRVTGNKRTRKGNATLNTSIEQTVPASGGATYGHQDDVAGYTLRGTFDGVDNETAAEEGAYVLQSDGDWHPVASVSETDRKAVVLPFRAYLLPSAHNAQARIRMSFEDTDGITAIETIDRDGTHRLYDLNGRQVDESYKGIVIKDGKKYLNK